MKDEKFDLHMQVLALMTFGMISNVKMSKILDVETRQVQDAKTYLKSKGWVKSALVPSKAGEEALNNYDADFGVDYD